MELMKRINWQSPYVWGGALLLLLVVSNIGFFFIRSPLGPKPLDHEHSFAGAVTSISETELSVTDAHGEVRSYSIGSTTRVTRGRDEGTISTVPVGTFVWVEEGGLGVANTVRVMNAKPHPPRDNSHTP